MLGNRSGAARRLRKATLAVGTTVFGVAVAAMVSVAIARTFTLDVAKNASVTNAISHATTHESIVTDAKGLPVYTLSGDSKQHPKCTKGNGCFKFWPPVTVASAAKLSRASGIKGKLGTWSRDGLHQVTLSGHPLYTFIMDTRAHANGQDFSGFRGVWHVIKTSSPTMTNRTGTTTTSPYPPGY
jgi:predicted lipoprotein with Yx(FWY)xxD motif